MKTTKKRLQELAGVSEKTTPIKEQVKNDHFIIQQVPDGSIRGVFMNLKKAEDAIAELSEEETDYGFVLAAVPSESVIDSQEKQVIVKYSPGSSKGKK